jgi:hypothetical protein
VKRLSTSFGWGVGPLNTLSPSGLERVTPSKVSGYASRTTLSNEGLTAGISYFAVIRRRDENVVKSGTVSRSGNLKPQVNGMEHTVGAINTPRKIYCLKECGKIRALVRRQNPRATVGRLCCCQIFLSEHLTEARGVQRKDTGVDAEEGVPAQHFGVSVLEVEGSVRSYDHGVNERLVIGGICNRKV